MTETKSKTGAAAGSKRIKFANGLGEKASTLRNRRRRHERQAGKSMGAWYQAVERHSLTIARMPLERRRLQLVVEGRAPGDHDEAMRRLVTFDSKGAELRIKLVERANQALAAGHAVHAHRLLQGAAKLAR